MVLCLAVRGRRIVRQAGKLPSMLQTTMGKRELKKCIQWYLETHGEENTREMLDNMKEVGFGWATRAGISLGVDDMSVPEKKAPLCDGSSQRQLNAEAKYQNGDITVVEKFLNVTEEWTRTSEKVKNEAVTNFKENDPDNPVYMMSTSGARGNISQVRQLLAMRGLMADAKGQLIDVPIQHCLREGMNVTDMLISGHGARKGVIDTALRTANSGYLYRRLDFTASPVVVRSEDCGTAEGWPMAFEKRKAAEASFADRIRGRVLADDVLHPKDDSLLFQKGHLLTAAEAEAIAQEWKECQEDGLEVPDVMIRTPLTCQQRNGICATCYGEDLSTPGKLAAIGHPSGTIAAQSMGEPGTQLTMRTFHTGGAFEGSAGEGVVAHFTGKVSLTCGSKNIAKQHISEAHIAVAKWKRSPQGDIGCVLAKACVLEVEGDGKTQTEELEPGCYVIVLDGAEVSFGQVLYQKPLKNPPSQNDQDVEVLNKPIQSGTSGEVFIQRADAERNCIDGGDLVWVLQGSCLDVQQDKGCSLAVQTGDQLAAGQPIVQEWAQTMQQGVPRFQEPPRTTKTKEALCMRTDFDSFELPAQQTTEYVVRGKIPGALQEDYHGNLPGVRKDLQKGLARSFKNAAKIRKDTVEAPVQVKVFTQVCQDDATGRTTVRTLCNAPSQGTGTVLSPTCREFSVDQLAPSGGLVLQVDWEGATSVLWSPEETIKFSSHSHQDIRNKHDECIGVGRELLFKRSNGNFDVETQESGTVVRRCRQRVYYSADLDNLEGDHWECAIKPGRVFFAPGEYFSEGDWWDAAEDGVYLHQRAIPPQVPVCSKLPSTKAHDDWIVVEILDDPRSNKNVRVLLRHTRRIDLPKHPMPMPMPAESQTMRFWDVPYHGEVVESPAAIILAHEILASVGRHPKDLHCATVSPTGQLVQSSGTFHCGAGDTPLDESSVWKPGDLCVVQHTPLGPSRAAAADSQWQLAEPGHELCTGSEQLIPRRAIPSQTGGIVCRAQLHDTQDSRRLTTVVLNGDDVIRVPCHAEPTCRVGDLLRRHDPLSAKEHCPQPGQVLSIQEVNEESGKYCVLLRKAAAYLVTNKGNIQVKNGSVVQMGDILATEPMPVPRTSDIVQGLPRIDRLFEAAGGQHQKRIDEIFAEEIQHRSGLDAAIHARFRFENELVSEIQSAYGEQGVGISSKHIEVVVRRMTEKCQILKGTSGLPPGTTLQYAQLEALCALQPSGEVQVRPLVMGLTEVGRDNSHVLMAMGFREVDNVLTSAVLHGTGRHALDGVKENLMIGKAASVGSRTSSKKQCMEFDLSRIPKWGND